MADGKFMRMINYGQVYRPAARPSTKRSRMVNHIGRLQKSWRSHLPPCAMLETST